MKIESVCVVVLGDIGRSPRMQYHALSLAEHGHQVDIIGYSGSEPLPALKTKPLVNFHYLAPCPNIPGPRVINYVWKTLWQAINLFFVMCIIRKSNVVLMQNPPAIPSILVCWLYCILFGAKYVIDWHNYAYSVLALSVGSGNLLVKISRFAEGYFGRKAHVNFCVTKGMKEDLLKNWNITATTLYDRPPEIFKPISLQDKHNLINRLSQEYAEFHSNNGENGNILSEELDGGEIILKKKRPGLLISSTSWTEDEDFSILLSALEEYETHHSNGNTRNLPDLLCIVTGKGPMKQFYSEKIQSLNWKHIKTITPWLEPEDYPRLLASADLGVCLHTSTSGLDLPMKVVDMFGCGLPVCALDFQCLTELVQDSKNGFTFKSGEELSRQIQDWFEGFPENRKNTEEKFKKDLEKFQSLRWTENWDTVAWSHFKS